MNDALRMHDHLDTIVIHSEKEMRLDDFECLVGERRAVDGDLASHRPRWMSPRLGQRRFFQLVVAPTADRAARCGENYSAHIGRGATTDTLKDCTVLAVYRNDLATAFAAGALCERSSN